MRKDLFAVGAAIRKGLQQSFKENKMDFKGKSLLAQGSKQTNPCCQMLFIVEMTAQNNVAPEDQFMLWHKH